jgi:hypothetical protein
MEASVYDRPVFDRGLGRGKLGYDDVVGYVTTNAPDVDPDVVWANLAHLLPSHVFTHRQHIDWGIEIERVNNRLA